MKKLKKFDFGTGRPRIAYNEQWLDGEIYELDETDLGPYPQTGPAGKLQALRKWALPYGYGLQGKPNTDNTALVIKAYPRPAEVTQ